MTALPDHCVGCCRHPRPSVGVVRWAAIVILVAAWLPVACSRYAPPEIQPDPRADRIVAALGQANADLTGFKCLGRVTLSGLDRPVASFRAAMAGRSPTRLRIDMIAPYGGASGTLAADGQYLFLVRHAAGEYLKKRLGDGSLQRVLDMDVGVDDLLELLMGRIPIDGACQPRMGSGNGENGIQIDLIDRRGRLCQRIWSDAALQPVRSEWYDDQQRLMHAASLDGHQRIDGFALPMQIELSGRSGVRLQVALERYEPNAGLPEAVFTPDRLE